MSMSYLKLTTLMLVLAAFFENAHPSTGPATCGNDEGKLHVLLREAGLASKVLEDRLDRLNASYISVKEKHEKSQKEIATLKRILAEVQAKLDAPSWSVTRVDEDLNKLTKIQLHLKTLVYNQKMPIGLPRNTKAVIISVFTNFWNRHGHAYLNFKTYQQRNERDGNVAVNNQHFNIYANTFYYELMLPWDTSLPDELVFEVKSSYLTGGYDNWYKIKLAGYITA